MAVRLTVRQSSRKTNPAVSALALALPNPARSYRAATDPLGLFTGNSTPGTAPRRTAAGGNGMIRVHARRVNKRGPRHIAAPRFMVSKPKRKRNRRRNVTVNATQMSAAAFAAGLGIVKTKRGGLRSPRVLKLAKHTSHRKANSRRRGRKVSVSRLLNGLMPKRRKTRKVRRSNRRRTYRVRLMNGRKRARKHVRRHRIVRKSNRRAYRTANRHHVRRHRKSNKGGMGKGLMGKIKTWALPVLGGAAGLALGRFVANMIVPRVGGGVYQQMAVGVATDIALMVGTQMLLPKLKFVPQSVRTGMMIGLGIDAVARVIGALIPTSTLSSLLLGSGGMAGMGQYDVYEAGLLGGVQGVGAYVTEPGGFQGIGSYVPEQLGASVYEAPAGMGTDVYEAPAGIGSYVMENGGPFDGGDDPNDDDFGLDPAEAAIEGLGAVQNSVEAAGGKLAYASNDGIRQLQGKGFALSPVAKSKRLPGVDIVAVQRSPQPPMLNPGYMKANATGRAFQSVPQTTGGNMPRIAGGIFEALYDV